MKRLIAFVLLCFLSVSMLVAQGNPNDDRIYDEVRRKLADDPDIKGGALDVTVANGAIILKGRVRDQSAKEKATRVTKKVKGVTTVDNQLKLFSEN
jgi:osmotically-inducible protein OsmY